MSSQAVYCLSLQIQSNCDENGNGKSNIVHSASDVVKSGRTAENSTSDVMVGGSTAPKNATAVCFDSAQQQHQHQQQHHHKQQHHQPQQLTNNIILLRGSRNENGQIIIQNKHDIISFINEGDKSLATLSTATTTTTTTATSRKTGMNENAAGVANADGNGNVTPSSSSVGNTILLQTPINASQLESVLLQSASMKKAMNNNNSGSQKGIQEQRSFLIQKQSARSFHAASATTTTDTTVGGGRVVTNNSSKISDNSKGPFVLQTLKRLEKSQSILVIRNSTATNVNQNNSNNNNKNNNSHNDTQSGASHNTSNASLSFSRTLKQSIAAAPGAATPPGHLTTKFANIITPSNRSGTTLGTLALTKATSTVKSSLNVVNPTFRLGNSSSSSSSSTTTTTTTPSSSSASLSYATANKNNSNKGNNTTGNSYNNSHNRNAVLHGDQLSSLDDVVQHKLEQRAASSSAGGGGGGGGGAGHHYQQHQQQHQQKANVPLGSDGEPIKLPDNLESLPRADSFPSQRHRWNTNEEIAAILISFDKHSDWQSKEVRTRPKSGSLLLYSRKKVRYRRDGYCWKKRKDGKTTREDHMKLKVQGTECIYGCYVHSAILPTFHRRCYWLLQNPDIVLVHYLNVPYPDDNKMAVIAPSLTLWGDKKEWTKEELVSQLKPMLSSVSNDDDSDSGNDIEISTAETVESLVCQLMEKQRLSRQAALVKQLDCGCSDSACIDGKSCPHSIRRMGLMKSSSDKRSEAAQYSTVASSTPNVVIGPKLYSRWPERRMRADTSAEIVKDQQEGSIKFQIIQPQQHHLEQTSSHHSNVYQQQHQQQQQQQQQQLYAHQSRNSIASQSPMISVSRNNLIISQSQSNFNQSLVNASNQCNQMNLNRFLGSNNLNLSHRIINATHITAASGGNSAIQVTKTTAAAAATPSEGGDENGVGVGSIIDSPSSNDGCSVRLIGGSNQNHITANNNNNSNGNSNNNKSSRNTNDNQLSSLSAASSSSQNSVDRNALNSSNAMNTYNTNNVIIKQQQQQQHQHHQHQQQLTNLSLPSVSSPSDDQLYKHQKQHHQQHQHHHHQQQQQQHHIHHHQQQQHQQQQQHAKQLQIHDTKAARLNLNLNSIGLVEQQQQQQTTLNHSTSFTGSNSYPSHAQHQHQQQQQQQQHTHHNHHHHHQHHPTTTTTTTTTIIDGNSTNPKQSSNLMSVSNNTNNERSNDDAGVGGNKCKVDTVVPSSSLSSSSSSSSSSSASSSSSPPSTSSPTSIVTRLATASEVKLNNNSTMDSDDDCRRRRRLDGDMMETCKPQMTPDDSLNSEKELNGGEDNNNDSGGGAAAIVDFASCCRDSIDDVTSSSATVNTSRMELTDSLSFFNETLDLSQEDIQRTLIANMPFGGSGIVKDEVDGVSPVLNPMDFIDNACSGNVLSSSAIGITSIGRGQVGVSCSIGDVVTTAHEEDADADDVFVNLDAFDMLVEFPELDFDEKNSFVGSHDSSNSADNNNKITNAMQFNGSNDETKSGNHCNRKVLTITDYGPEWSYTEGGVKVLVTGPWLSTAGSYTVLFDSLPVPTILVQEGVLRCYCPAHEVGFATLQVSCDGFVVSNSVMFEYKTLPCPEAPFDAASNDCLYKFTLLNRLTSIDEKMQIKTENNGLIVDDKSFLFQSNFEERLVNYCHRLTGRAWRSNTCGWSIGFKGMTLLHLASALGYSKLVCSMLNWRSENPNIILETEIDALSQDVYGYTPMTWACARGHLETALILYKWNHNAVKMKNFSHQTPLDVANIKGYKNLLSDIFRLELERNNSDEKSSSFGKSFKSKSGSLCKYSRVDENSRRHSDKQPDVQNTDSVSSNGDSGDSQRSHDGVFLRPVPLSSNQSPPNNNSRFSKRSSVDSGINMDVRSMSKSGKPFKDLIRLQSCDGHDSYSLSIDSPLDSLTTSNGSNSLLSPLRKMDFALCEVSTGKSSPTEHGTSSSVTGGCSGDAGGGDSDNDDITDVVNNNETDVTVGDSDAKVLTLAEHIIAAMPERIKNEADEMMVLGSPMTEPLSSDASGLNNLNDGFMDPLLDSLPSAHFDTDFSLEASDHCYRYHDVSTPCSSLSPASSGPLQSPASYSIGLDPSVNSPSPPPSTKQLTEFLHASSKSQCPFEADFSKLTLTDSEQRELYEAAKCIQKAYRSYKGRQKLEEQNKERSAAIVIQNYYRRYKEYAYFRQMTNAALVIQHGYRSYCKNKRFKKSQTIGSSLNNSQCLSSFYNHFKNEQHEISQPTTPKETSPSGPLKRTYSQSTQNQAARKIQQFMRQSRIKLQRERAEKERLVHLRREEYLQNLQYPGQQRAAIAFNLGRSKTR